MEILKNKKAKMDMLGVILVIAAIILVFQSGALNNIFPKASTTDSGKTEVPASNKFEVVGAPCTQATTLTVSTVRRYTDVAQTSQNATIFQNGVLKGTIAHGSTTTVQSGPNADELDIYPAYESTTFYPQHLRGKLTTCTGSATTGDSSFKFVNDDSPGGAGINYADYPHKVVQIDTDGNSNWFSIVNDGQANQNTGRDGNNLTVGQGGTGSVTITFRPAYNRGLGVIGGNILACQFAQAVYDSATPLVVSYKGTSLSEADKKPSSQNYPLIGSNNTVKAFKFPGVDGRKDPTSEIKVLLRADSNHNPAGALDRVNCTLFDVSYYQRQSDGKLVLDIENRDTNADVGGSLHPSFEIGVA